MTERSRNMLTNVAGELVIPVVGAGLVEGLGHGLQHLAPALNSTEVNVAAGVIGLTLAAAQDLGSRNENRVGLALFKEGAPLAATALFAGLSHDINTGLFMGAATLLATRMGAGIAKK